MYCSFFFSSRRRHTRFDCDWSSDVCSSDLRTPPQAKPGLDRASSLLGEVLDSRYQVQNKLGEGGMSFVYLAREVSTGHDVAIKVLSPKLATDRSSVERLRREAGLAMRLDHPNVCRILRLGESEDGLIYLVMPFLKGDLLSDRERSEEHTSELQSQSNLVCRLLLEKKKKKKETNKYQSRQTA